MKCVAHLASRRQCAKCSQLARLARFIIKHPTISWPLMNLVGDKQRPIDRRQASRHSLARYRFILRRMDTPRQRTSSVDCHPRKAPPASITDCFNYFRFKVMCSVARSILWTNIVLLLPVSANETAEREREREREREVTSLKKKKKKRHVAD